MGSFHTSFTRMSVRVFRVFLMGMQARWYQKNVNYLGLLLPRIIKDSILTYCSFLHWYIRKVDLNYWASVPSAFAAFPQFRREGPPRGHPVHPRLQREHETLPEDASGGGDRGGTRPSGQDRLPEGHGVFKLGGESAQAPAAQVQTQIEVRFDFRTRSCRARSRKIIHVQQILLEIDILRIIWSSLGDSWN